MSILLFFIILIVLVIIHEFGHFLAAKKNGVYVEEFGIGFPPRLFGKKIGETLYSINLIPLGGFVKLYGEEYHEVEGGKQKIASNRAFINKKPWQKVSIIVAGVVMHFVLGWVLISYLFTQGIPTPLNKVRIEKVLPSTPAQQAGLKEKDIVYALTSANHTYPITSTEKTEKETEKTSAETESVWSGIELLKTRTSSEEAKIKLTVIS